MIAEELFNGRAHEACASPLNYETYSRGRPGGTAGSCAAGSGSPADPEESGRLSVPGPWFAGRGSCPIAVGSERSLTASDAAGTDEESRVPLALRLAGSLSGLSAVFGIAGCGGLASVEAGV